MQNFDWITFASQLSIKAVDIIFGAIGGLIAAWLAYKFGIKSEIIKIKTEMNQSIEKDRIIKQSQILDDIWSKAYLLIGKAAILTSRLKEHPDFKYLTDDALDEFLQSSFLTQRQKRELKASADRNDYYLKAKNWHEYNETRSALVVLHSSIQDNRIRIPLPLLDEYDKLIKSSNDLLTSFEIWLESREHALFQQSYKEFQQTEELISIIEQKTRSYFIDHAK